MLTAQATHPSPAFHPWLPSSSLSMDSCYSQNLYPVFIPAEMDKRHILPLPVLAVDMFYQLYWLDLCINLTQASVVRKEGASPG